MQDGRVKVNSQACDYSSPEEKTSEPSKAGVDAQITISQSDAARKKLAVEDWSPCPDKGEAEQLVPLNKAPSGPGAHKSSSTEESTESDSEKDAAEVFVGGKPRQSLEQASGSLSSAFLEPPSPLFCGLGASIIIRTFGLIADTF